MFKWMIDSFKVRDLKRLHERLIERILSFKKLLESSALQRIIEWCTCGSKALGSPMLPCGKRMVNEEGVS